LYGLIINGKCPSKKKIPTKRNNPPKKSKN
jgi:hypothetical protein